MSKNKHTKDQIGYKKGIGGWPLLIFLGLSLSIRVYKLSHYNVSRLKNLESYALSGGEKEIKPHLSALNRAFRERDTEYACTVHLQLAELIAESYSDISSKAMNQLNDYQKKCGGRLTES